MKITWVGHACFLIEGHDVTVLTDPYNEQLPYKSPSFPADIVTVSHEHFDHNATNRVLGSPSIVRGPGEHTSHGIKFTGIPTFHDEEQGKRRGTNTIFTFAVDGINIAHFGDLGHLLAQEQLAALSQVELVMIPVGGYFTIGAEKATEIVQQLPKVKVIIPMHYKTDALGDDFPIDRVDNFLTRMQNIKQIDSAEAALMKDALPARPEVWVLSYA
jgi:L-ascorbate metabolism protein UlaG (beta-lactamase superfamily)